MAMWYVWQNQWLVINLIIYMLCKILARINVIRTKREIAWAKYKIYFLDIPFLGSYSWHNGDMIRSVLVSRLRFRLKFSMWVLCHLSFPVCAQTCQLCRKRCSINQLTIFINSVVICVQSYGIYIQIWMNSYMANIIDRYIMKMGYLLIGW